MSLKYEPASEPLHARRSVCHIQPETHAENIALASVARTCFPKAYELRQAEVAFLLLLYYSRA